MRGAPISCVLLGDGRSDRALIPVLEWLLRDRLPGRAAAFAWADLERLPRPPKGLKERMKCSIVQNPSCEILFVHRDAERETREQRVAEIVQASAEVAWQDGEPPILIATIPVRMLEAWLLIEEAAIRKAASNPGGKRVLRLPECKRLEQIPDPKQQLYDLLRDACELQGRRRGKFEKTLHRAVHDVARYIDDFSPLRNLSAFRAMEQEISQRVVPKFGILTTKQVGK